jgi:hypothetical protein
MRRVKLRRVRAEAFEETTQQYGKPGRPRQPFVYRPSTKAIKPGRRVMKEQWVPADETFCWLLAGKRHRRLALYLMTMKPPKPRWDNGELVA